jgi:hypothetical protein
VVNSHQKCYSGHVALEQVRFRPFDEWLGALPVVVAAEIAASVDYLCEHGRSASLPYVRHRIQTSRNFPDMSEIRTDHSIAGNRYVMRVLTCFVDEDSKLLVCLGGNKHRWEQIQEGDWYETYVPAADLIIEKYRGRGEKK